MSCPCFRFTTETLKLLSKLFHVSINTLLGSPRQLICQCCGMPLEDESISKERDGSRCFGIAANADFILVCSYEESGENPELVVYKKR